MDYQGGGAQPGGTTPRQPPGEPTGPQEALARGYPPTRTRQPQQDWFSPGADYPPHDQEAAEPGAEPTTEPIDGPPGGPLGGPPPPDGRDRPRPRRGPRPRRRPVLLGAAGLVALAAAGFAGYHYLGKSHSTVIHPGATLRLPTSDPTAGSPYFTAKLGKWQHIGTRKLDPVPLSTGELYPVAFMLFGKQYTRAAATSDKDCTLVVFGNRLQTALTSGKCTQVVRASYVSGDAKMMGTIGVINLSTASAAQQAGQVTGADQLIAPLTAAKGPAKNLLSGTGVVYAEVKGHYLILMYAEFTNLKSPSTATAKQQLVDFAKNAFDGSANISLSNRMLTGRPA